MPEGPKILPPTLPSVVPDGAAKAAKRIDEIRNKNSIVNGKRAVPKADTNYSKGTPESDEGGAISKKIRALLVLRNNAARDNKMEEYHKWDLALKNARERQADIILKREL